MKTSKIEAKPTNTAGQPPSGSLHSACSPSGVEALVCADIAARQKLGVAKYKTTVANNPLSLREWLQHTYEECLDQAVYLKRAMSELPPMPKICRNCGGDGLEEIQSGPYFRKCPHCAGTGKANAEVRDGGGEA